MQAFSPFPHKPCFLRVCRRSRLKKGGKGKIACYQQSFSHGIFYPFGELFTKIEIVVCKIFQFGSV